MLIFKLQNYCSCKKFCEVALNLLLHGLPLNIRGQLIFRLRQVREPNKKEARQVLNVLCLIEILNSQNPKSILESKN